MTPQSRTLHPAAAAARIAPLLLALAGLAIAIGSQWLWRHRRQIGTALVATAAAAYSAGAWCRLQVEALASDSARRLPNQPVAAVAPITATLAAAWGLVDRAAMARGHRAQRARMADTPSAYGLELDDLLRPRFCSAAGVSRSRMEPNEPWQLQAVLRIADLKPWITTWGQL